MVPGNHTELCLYASVGSRSVRLENGIVALLISDPRTKVISKSRRKKRKRCPSEDIDCGGEKSDCESEEEEESGSSDDGDSVEEEEEEDGNKEEEKNNAIQVSS